MRVATGNYKGLTARELVDRDPGYADWFWRHAGKASKRMRQEVRAVLAEVRLARLSYQYDRLTREIEGMKRQHRIRVPSAEELNFEKVRADGLEAELTEAYRTIAEKDRELASVKEVFKKLRAEYARVICPSRSGTGRD